MDVVDDGSRSGRRTDVNPFSFKRFLQPTGLRRSPGCAASASLATLDLANDLPDFVQDHYHSDREHVHPRGARSQATTDVPLPDFALDTDLHGRFHTSDLHSFAAADAGRWMPGDASSIPSSDITSHHSERSDYGLHSPVISNSAVRVSQLSDFSVDSETENNEHLDGFGLLDRRTSESHKGHCTLTPTDGPLLVAANSTGGLPDFLSDSALGVVDVCARNTTTAAAAASDASTTVQSSRVLTNGFASPDSESESVLSRVKLLTFLSVCESGDFFRVHSFQYWGRFLAEALGAGSLHMAADGVAEWSWEWVAPPTKESRGMTLGKCFRKLYSK